MNVHVPSPPQQTPAKRVRPVKTRRRDQQFLPGALEILETPAAPLATTMILVIGLFFTVATIWAYVGRIDIIAVAQGKLQPTGQVKTIQSLETGRVVVNTTENGRHVRAGEILIELDPNAARAEKDAIDADLQGVQAEIVRRITAIRAARTGDVTTVPQIDWAADVPEMVRNREQQVMLADLTQLAAQIASFEAQRVQKIAERTKLVATIKAQDDLIAVLKERVSMRAKLEGSIAFSKSNVLDATEMLRAQQATLVQETGQIGEIDANLAVIARDRVKAVQTFVAENAQKLDEAQRQVATLTGKLTQARTKLDNLIIKSPITGIVQSSTVTTSGQVVSASEELMRIVPDDDALEIEAYLPNKDIGFVKIGQKAVVKVESFPFTRYGTIDAIVTRVARDAIPEPDAAQAEGDPSHLRRDTRPAGADRIQNLVFAVTLKPLRTNVNVDGVAIPLGAGMAVTSEIRTGSRRILEYVFSPLVQVGSEAMKER